MHTISQSPYPFPAEVTIDPCIRETAQGYVALFHGQQYTVVMTNHDQRRRCAAVLTIDEQEIGTFRIEPGQTSRIERSPHDQGRFTFYITRSQEAVTSGITSVDRDQRGVVRVTFIPEFLPIPTTPIYETTRGGGDEDDLAFYLGTPRGGPGNPKGGFISGGTGVSGRSHQQFRQVDAITRDEENTVTIILRLVADSNDQPRPLPGRVLPPPVRD